MRFAYLIMAHRDLEQLRLLIARLLREDSRDFVVLHVDRRSAISDADLAELKKSFGSSVILTRRIPCKWGNSSLCRAQLLLLEALEGREYDYAHFMSAQDWLIRSKADLLEELQPGACYLALAGTVDPERMRAYHFHTWLIAPTMRETSYTYRMRKLLQRAGSLWTRLAGPRSCPFGPEWVKGSSWWSLPQDAVNYLRPRLRSALRSGRLYFTICSDEYASQTILACSQFGERIQRHRWFLIWTGGTSPKVLTRSDLPAMRASGAWFARKVDRHVDPFFLEL